MVVALSRLLPLLIQGIFWVMGTIGGIRALTGQPIIYASELGQKASGGAITPSAGAQVPSAPPAVLQAQAQRENAAQVLANPWLYAGIAACLLFGSVLVRQTRGLGRDIGSGVKSTRGAVKEDFREIQADPD